MTRRFTALLLALALAACFATARAQTLALIHFTLIDGSGAPPVPDSALIIDSGGRIEWVDFRFWPMAGPAAWMRRKGS